MPSVQIKYSQIDEILGSAAIHDKDNSFSRLSFLRCFTTATAAKHGTSPNSFTISEDTNAGYFLISSFKEQVIWEIFNVFANKEKLSFFKIDDSNILAVVAWLKEFSSPEKYEIGSFFNATLALVFKNTDDALKFKLANEKDNAVIIGDTK